MTTEPAVHPAKRESSTSLYLIAAIVVLVLGMGGLTALGWVQGSTDAPGPGTGRVLPPAPDFALARLDNGAPIRLSDLRGTAVVVNFWGSWCPPCRQEMPAFQEVYQRYRTRGVEFVGIAVDDRADTAKAFAREIGITYPLALDGTGEVSALYEAMALPMTVFVTPRGERSQRWVGIIDEAKLTAFIDEALGNG